MIERNPNMVRTISAFNSYKVAFFRVLRRTYFCPPGRTRTCRQKRQIGPSLTKLKQMSTGSERHRPKQNIHIPDRTVTGCIFPGRAVIDKNNNKKQKNGPNWTVTDQRSTSTGPGPDMCSQSRLPAVYCGCVDTDLPFV